MGKDSSVCVGCKYRMSDKSTPYLSGTCNYLEVNNRSRLMIEKANGGYKTDSCICYERKGK